MRPRATNAWLLTTVLGIAYWIVSPPSADLAAQEYRVDLAKRSGFVLWDNAWYAGHHIPGYSILFPPLGSLATAQIIGVLAAIACAWTFGRIAQDHWGDDGTLGAWWFAAGISGMLLTGRLTFALGLAFGLAAVRLASRDTRTGRVAAPIAAVLTTLASPVAGLFLAMGAGAWFLVDRARRWDAVAIFVAALLPALALSVAFPEGGIEPFHAKSFWPALGVLVVLAIILPRREKLLRAGVIVYALACTLSFVVETPMGNNVTRLGALFAGPLLACVLWPRHRVLLLVCSLPLVYWQFLAPVQDWSRTAGDPSVHYGYYTGLLDELEAKRDSQPPFRIEVPFTRSHWETRYIAPHLHLARGWERQLDIERNDLFYGGTLTPARYRTWLDDHGVRYVALPKDTTLDHSAIAEAQLIAHGLPYLHRIWQDEHWTVYEVADPTPIAEGGATLIHLSSDGFTLRATRPNTTTVVHVHWTPYWELEKGTGCVEKAPGDWTRVRLTSTGRAHVGTRFGLDRIGSSSPRCTG
jgi:hypothetical protein